MQLFVRSTVGRTMVLEMERDSLVCDLKERVEALDGVPADLQFVVFGSRALEECRQLSDCKIEDGATLTFRLRLRGGAAEKAKAAAAAKKLKEEQEKEYTSWYKRADLTETTGVMRLLIVSQNLKKHVDLAQGKEEERKEANPFFKDGPSADEDCYDNDEGDEDNLTGWPGQKDYDATFKLLMENFNEHWSEMKVLKEKEAGGRRLYIHKGYDLDSNVKVEVKCGAGYDGLWYQGPKQIILEDVPKQPYEGNKEDWEEGQEPVWKKEGNKQKGDVVWDLEKEAKNLKLWHDETNSFRPPWKICGQYSEIERWLYGGIGTTTYTLNAKGQMTLWSQEDQDGCLGLTDREKMRLRQKMQIEAKNAKGKKLTPDEDELKKEVDRLVDKAPCYFEGSSGNPIYSWQIKSLKKILAKKVVFWSNSEKICPCGSVADKSSNEKPAGGIEEDGHGNESLEFWKYEKKIGMLRKKYIKEDRQRLLDQIERFTPTYKAVIKNQGQDSTEDHGDHWMIMDYQRKITNIVALALDMNMPDYEEDRIACFIKTLVEKRIGPTWHVLVGRSFGFSVQCEARHFLHLYMQHLAVVIWKFEPDPNAGKKG